MKVKSPTKILNYSTFEGQKFLTCANLTVLKILKLAETLKRSDRGTYQFKEVLQFN